MTNGRRHFVEALIVLLVGGSLYAVTFDADRYWPFSTYPMYATAVRTAFLHSYRIEGVTANGKIVSLMGSDSLQPFESARLTSAMRLLERSPARRRVALASLRDVYNRRVESGQIHGQTLIAIRLYRAWWALDGASLAPEASPGGQVLVEQVGRTAGS